MESGASRETRGDWTTRRRRNNTMAWKIFALVAVLVSCSTPAYPCSVARMRSPTELIKDADLIVLVQAEGLSAAPDSNAFGSMAGSQTQVRFRIIETFKGTSRGATIEFNGSWSDQDDRNDRPAPYDFVRPGGRHGNCFALEYRQGAQYLLLLKRSSEKPYTQPDILTPYWAPLAPTNEQVFGASDPWVAWVRKAAAGR